MDANDRELRDNPLVWWLIHLSERSPGDVVFAQAKSEVRSRLRSFVLPFVISVVLLWMIFGSNHLSEIPILGMHPVAISGFLVSIGVGLFVAQMLLTFERCHHLVFRPTKKRIRHRIGLAAFGMSTSAFLIYYYYPTTHTLSFPPQLPLFGLYSAISTVVAALVIPFITKLLWDYFKPTRQDFIRYYVLFGFTVLGSVTSLLYYTHITGQFTVTPVDGGAYIGTVGLVGVSLGWSIYTSLESYIEGNKQSIQKYESESYISQFVETIETRTVTVISGVCTGLGLPIYAGIYVWGEQSLSYTHLSDILLFGLLSIGFLVAILAFVWLFFFAISVIVVGIKTLDNSRVL